MTRLHADGLGGTLSADVSNTATSMSAAVFSSMPAVAAPNTMVWVLDPLGEDGPLEKILVRAHTAGSSTISSVERGFEGTVAREHAAGTKVRHGVVASDIFDPGLVLVTDFGADPKGVLDSSGAFEDALAEAVARRDGPNVVGAPAVAVPPGRYKLSSTVTIDEATVPGSVTVVGLGDQPSAIRIMPPSDGVTPAFFVNEKINPVTFKNMAPRYGRALRAEGCAQLTLHDFITNASLPGVAPVQIINTFEFKWTASRTVTEESASHTPMLEYIGDSFAADPTADTSYLLTVEDLVPTGGGIRLIQSGTTSGAPHQFHFNRIIGESLKSDAMVSVEVGRAFYDAQLASSINVTVPSGDFTGADVGRRISHPAIPAGTTVATVVDATHITLSAAAVATISPVTVVVNRPISMGTFAQLTFEACANYDQTGTCQMLRSALNANHNISAVFSNCSAANLNRIWLNLSGNAFGTWIGSSLANELICDTTGARSATGFPTVISGSTLMTNGVSVKSGTGTPEAAVTGNVGDIFLRKDGGAGTCFYVKESGAATNTGWVAK